MPASTVPPDPPRLPPIADESPPSRPPEDPPEAVIPLPAAPPVDTPPMPLLDPVDVVTISIEPSGFLNPSSLPRMPLQASDVTATDEATRRKRARRFMLPARLE